MMIVKLGTSLGKSLDSRSFQERASLPAVLLKEKITIAGECESLYHDRSPL
jgi:hypothetical protein